MVDKKRRRGKKEIQEIKDTLYEEAQSGDHAHTGRHLFYRLVSRGIQRHAVSPEILNRRLSITLCNSWVSGSWNRPPGAGCRRTAEVF
jgi:hypothetical protein